MNSVFLMILFFMVLFLFFYKSRINVTGINNDYLSYETTKTLKGICAILIVLHHFSTNLPYLAPFFCVFNPIGQYIVALFFFFSGYGLIYSKKNKPNYMNTFLRKRFCSIFIPYLIAIAIYTVVKYLLADITFKDVVASFIANEPIVDYSWFVVAILISYLLFWLSFSVFKSRALFVVLFLSLFAIAIINPNFTYWRPSSLTFLLGMLWAQYKDKIDKFLFEHYYRSLIVASILIAVFLVGEKMINVRMINMIFSAFTLISFVVLCMLVMMKLTVNNSMLKMIVPYSFEIYICHGLYIFFFKNNGFLVSNSSLYLVLLLVLTIISAVLLNKVNSVVLKHTIYRQPKITPNIANK